MSPSEASAPAKLILCGEHAVVYGCPAIALPLDGLRASVSVTSAAPGNGISFSAPDIGTAWHIDDDVPLSVVLRATLSYLNIRGTDLALTLRSTIPIASGLGSGAAIATALVRAISDYFGAHLSPDEISALVYRSEERFHGTPSGIDNAVIAYEQAIWYRRNLSPGQSPNRPTIEPIELSEPLLLVLGDTGIRCETRLPVGEVRRRWEHDPVRYEQIFAEVAEVVEQARHALATGDQRRLGELLTINQGLLEQIGVSSPELERLVAAARAAGALGAKLSGGGWGGIMFALVDEQTRDRVMSALHDAGAANVFETRVVG